MACVRFLSLTRASFFYKLYFIFHSYIKKQWDDPKSLFLNIAWGRIKIHFSCWCICSWSSSVIWKDYSLFSTMQCCFVCVALFLDSLLQQTVFISFGSPPILFSVVPWLFWLCVSVIFRIGFKILGKTSLVLIGITLDVYVNSWRIATFTVFTLSVHGQWCISPFI